MKQKPIKKFLKMKRRRNKNKVEEISLSFKNHSNSSNQEKNLFFNSKDNHTELHNSNFKKSPNFTFKEDIIHTNDYLGFNDLFEFL